MLVTEVSSSALKELGNSWLEFTAVKGQSVSDDWKGNIDFDGSVLELDTDIWGELLTRLRMLEQNQEAEIHADPGYWSQIGKQRSSLSGTCRFCP